MFLKSDKTKFLLFVVAFLVIISGCQGNNNREQQEEIKPTMRANSQTKQAALSDKSQQSAVKENTYGSQTTEERKIIKEANLKIITKDLDPISEQVNQIIKTYDGYLANSNQWQSDRKHYNFIIKVPQKNFKTALGELEKIGTVNNKQISSRDITKEYIDLQSRLKSFKAQEERYLELLDEAKNVEEMLQIEKELNRIRRNIEQIQGQLNYYDNKIAFSTINVTFTEPKPVINSHSWGVLDSIKQAIQEFVASIKAIIIITGALLPWLILIALLSLLGYKLYQLKNKK